jgi:hypothetical protein
MLQVLRTSDEVLQNIHRQNRHKRPRLLTRCSFRAVVEATLAAPTYQYHMAPKGTVYEDPIRPPSHRSRHLHDEHIWRFHFPALCRQEPVTFQQLERSRVMAVLQVVVELVDAAWIESLTADQSLGVRLREYKVPYNQDRGILLGHPGESKSHLCTSCKNVCPQGRPKGFRLDSSKASLQTTHSIVLHFKPPVYTKLVSNSSSSNSELVQGFKQTVNGQRPVDQLT